MRGVVALELLLVLHRPGISGDPKATRGSGLRYSRGDSGQRRLSVHSAHWHACPFRVHLATDSVAERRLKRKECTPKRSVSCYALLESLTCQTVDAADRISAEGFTSSNEATRTGSQGRHHPRLLVITDEAFGIHEMLWQPLLSQASEIHNRVVFVRPPDPSSGAARRDRSGHWHRIRISCRDHSNVEDDREVIPGAVPTQCAEEVKAALRENFGVYASRVLAEYPQADATEVLAPSAVLMACLR